jgi:hypothetical protein
VLSSGDAVGHSLSYYTALKNAGVPAELHLYAEGGTLSASDERSFRLRNGPGWLNRGSRQSE